jgi:polyisoprenoid-binding protein YceI
LPEATDGSENFRLGGILTLRGVSRPLEFPVVVAADGEGKLTGQAWLDLDRTEFGSIYGSGRFFRFLGQHVVNDIIHLHLKIHASRA